MAETVIPEGAAPQTPQTRQERLDYGRSVIEAVNSEAAQQVLPALEDVSPVLAEQVLIGFAEFYGRPQLSPRDRQLVTLGILTALGGCESQLEVHVNTSLNVGLTPEQIVEALLHSAAYCGFPRALNATFAAKRVFAERGLLPVGGAEK
ncbi:MAG TPA: carboxymuconolactone decarboxylase family protein [Actinocrinis sp.]|jgi:4-carboxymuconolactone decarboxylase|uniref:carboxymuconolactone decarboxylase family protein n=1 Tax=Actinocrinis sp. TaxID=1920516 RepID=UPI002DDD9F37|nr:carboxymuconolactone decarboxylase family protein [Actinocrinis sp.]HEV3173712.1 carboxymuconolactone decarboxylase family protein [Actinocrinis sp.]